MEQIDAENRAAESGQERLGFRRKRSAFEEDTCSQEERDAVESGEAEMEIRRCLVAPDAEDPAFEPGHVAAGGESQKIGGPQRQKRFFGVLIFQPAVQVISDQRAEENLFKHPGRDGVRIEREFTHIDPEIQDRNDPVKQDLKRDQVEEGAVLQIFCQRTKHRQCNQKGDVTVKIPQVIACLIVIGLMEKRPEGKCPVVLGQIFEPVQQGDHKEDHNDA